MRVGTGIIFNGNSHNSFAKSKGHYDYAYEVPAGVLLIKNGIGKVIGNSNILEMDVLLHDDNAAKGDVSSKRSKQALSQ